MVKKYYSVVVEMPPDAYAGEFKSYLIEAIRCWGGQFHPDDALFYGAKVKSIKPIKDQNK